MINALDYTGDGAIDEDEFIQWVTTGMTRTRDERSTFSNRVEKVRIEKVMI